MKTALVIGASGGIGQAISAALASRGVAVTGLSRSRDGFDVTDPALVDRILGALDGPFDLVFVALGILAPPGGAPEKSLEALSLPSLQNVFAVNTFGPALILRHVARLMPRDRRAICAVLSARVGSIGDNMIGGWYGYRASKAALNQIVHSAAIELTRSHRQAVVVALHPGTVATPFTSAYAGRHKTIPADEAAAHLLGVIDGLQSDQTGRFFDYAGLTIPW